MPENSSALEKAPSKKSSPPEIPPEIVPVSTSPTGFSGSRPNKKSLDDLREEKKKEAKKPKEEKKKDGRGRKKKEKPVPVTDAAILELLKLPFFGAGVVTGYFDPAPIPKDAETQLVASGRIIMDEFGLEAFGKWINIGVFAGLYGLCGYQWYTRYLAFQEINKAVPVDAKVKESEPVTSDQLRVHTGTPSTDTVK